MTRVVLTNHARERAAEMGIRTKEVKRAVRDPEVERPSPPQYRACRMAAAGRVAVPYSIAADGTRVVVTVLWNTNDEWTREEQGVANLD